MIWFIVGLVVGVSLGMLLMSILVISKQSEERAEQMRRENNIIINKKHTNWAKSAQFGRNKIRSIFIDPIIT